MRGKNELELKRVWEKMANTLAPEEVVFGPPGKYWSRIKDLEIFGDLRKYLDTKENEILLDIGCGPLARAEVQFGLRGNFIIGVDISTTTLKKAKETTKKWGLSDTTEFVLAEAEHLPFQDNSFNIVLCIGVISHLPSVRAVRRALQQIQRSLKTGGKVYTTWLLNLYSVWCIQEALKFSILGPDREQHLKFRGLPEIRNVFNESRFGNLKIRYGILLYKLTILYPYLPAFMQKKIISLGKTVDSFHRKYPLLSFFSRSFEVTAQKTNANIGKTGVRVSSFYEPPF